MTREPAATPPDATSASPRAAPGHVPMLNQADLMTALFETTREAILISDDARRFVAANPAACELLGRPLADVLKMRVDDLAPPEARPAAEQAWAQYMANGEQLGQLMITRSDGQVRHVDYRARANIRPGFHASLLRDVTEQVIADRAADAERAHREHQYRLIAEHASDMVFLVSPKGIVEWVSPSVESATGWAPDDLMGNPTSKLVDPSQRAALQEFARQLRQGMPFHAEMPILTRGGEARWMDFSLEPVRGGDGAIESWVGAVRDIQARHDAEASLRASRDLLGSIIGATDESIFAKDLEGRYLLFNAAAAATIGRSAEDVIGHTDADLFPPDEAAVIMARDHEILAAGVTTTIDERLTFADGRSHWLLSTKGALRATDGQLIGLFGVSRDLTDRIAAERALSESERRLRELYDGVDSMLFHREGIEDSVALNPAATRILGYAAERLGDRLFWHSLVHPDDLEAALATWSAGGQNWDMKYRMQRADGAWIWVRDRGNRSFAPDGSVERTFSLVDDITDAQRIEAQFTRASSLESLGRLASGLAHDFNNLLVGIGLIADWIEHHPNDPGVAEETRGILETVERGKQMTRALLAFARGGTAAMQRTDLADFLPSAASLTQRLLGRLIMLNLHIAPDLPEVVVDRTGLSQVLLNLAINARDAMPDGGSIDIDARSADVTGRAAAAAAIRPGRYIHITIADTGTGIPPELLDRVFEPWFTTKEGEGTGLGLAMAFGFARANGGGITAESKQGEGTTFHLYLPIPDASVTGRGPLPTS